MAHRPQPRSGGDPRPMRPPARGWLRSLLRAWAPGRGEVMASAAPVMEEYEQRLLYSADLAPHALLSADPAQAVEQRVLDAQGDYVSAQHQASAPGVELLFVDAGVQNSDALASELSQADGRRIEVVTLDATADGIGQISALLAGRNDVAALHILSHGSDGEIRVGNGVLDVAQLAARRDEIAQWGAALAADADILLYGCDVASGSAGEAFVRQLSALTRADVAASNDLTGNASLGGDWTLEFAVGQVDNATISGSTVDAQWSGVLATFSVTTDTGNGNGSLRKAIEDANASLGADTIVFNIAGAGVRTITLNNDLVITDRLTLDGTQNNGATANGGLPGIIIDGGDRSFSGLTLADGSDGSVIRGLVIRNFNGNGIEIAAGADGITVANNFIGNFDADGTRASGSDSNTGAGIHVNSLFNTIGGTAATDRNIISGNAGAGILVENPAGTSVLIAPNNEIVGNIIGMEGDGTTALPNSIGIQLRDGAQWDRVLGNNISGNTGSGILIGDSGAQVHDVLIGGSGSDGNKIAQNGGDGVTVMSGLHNTILSNSISGNAGLGIDLRNNAASVGVTANDIGDADGGGNELQNFPILSSAQIVSGTQVRLIGTLNAAAGTQHLIEFFSNTAGDPSGNGEGQTLLGNVTVTTNGSGSASFNTLINATLPAGSIISATATNFYTVIIIPVRGSTSEFSNNVVLGNTAPVLDAARSPQLLSTPAGAPAPVGAAGTLVSALVDFSAPAGQLDNVTDADSGAQLGIAITGVDTANGTLYYSLNGGTGWTAVGAVSDGNALLLGVDGATRLYYQANAGASGTLASAVTFRAWDRTTGASGSFMSAGINGGATAFSAAADDASLTVTGVNSAPVNTVPGAQTVNEDTPLAIAGISVNDGDGNLSSTQLTVNNGVLEVNLAGGAVIIAGANTSGDLTLGGTQAQINAALATLKYQGSLNFSGSDTLRVLSTDGAATPLSNTDTITLTVNAVNDAPSSGGGSVSGSEDTPHVFTWAQFNVTDADSPITGATAVRMDVLPASGKLQYLNGSLWTAVALGQVIDKSSIDAGQLRFVPTADESGHDGYATPGVGNLLQDYARFSFTPVHTAAIAIVNPGGEANGLGEGAFQNPAVGWTTSGADAGAQNLTPLEYPIDHDASLYVNDGATLTQTLAATFSAARNYNLSFEFGWRNDDASEPGFRVELWAGATLMGSMDETAIAGVQGTFVSGVLNMVGTTSGAVEGSALQIRLVGTGLQANFDNLKLVSFNAASDIGVAAQMNVDIVPVNDAPTATNLSAAETYTEDSALNLTNIVVSDIDSANVTATLTLSNAAAGSLNTATSGAVTSTYVAGTGVWTASGAIASVNTLLAGLTFTPAANFNGAFTIATSVSDGVAPALTGSKAMTGAAVNDAPTATNLNAAETYTEDTALNLTNIVISDIDSAIVSATLTLSNPAAGSLNTATAGAVTSTYNAGTGAWTASGAIADVNTLLAGLTFTPAADFNGAFSIATSVSDGVAAPLTGSKAMTGVAVNDAPTATNLNAAETYTEDTALNLTNIVVSDIDSANVTATLTLSNAAAGSLNTATAGAVTSTYNAGTGAWTASGAIASVNSLLAGLTFTPAANFNGAFSIATSVSDGVAPALTGGKAMTGTAVNDAPGAIIAPASFAATEQVALALQGAGLSVTDVDAGTATVQVTLSVVAGTLSAGAGTTGVTLGGGGASLSLIGNINQINNLLNGVGGSTLTYVMNSDTPPAADTLTLQIDDLGNIGGGSLTAQDTAAINITAINDAPVAVAVTLAAIAEDSGVRLITSAQLLAGVTDVDGPALAITSLAIAGGGGALIDNGNGSWNYTPALNDDSAVNFNYTASDGVSSASSTAALDITPVNDAPLAVDDVLPAAANTPLTTVITVLSGNDTDIEGTPLTVIAVGNATHGTVALAGGVVTFTPDAGFTGAASYEYTVSDGGLTDVGVVTVNVGGINTAPVANADLLAATEDVSVTYTAAQLLGNDTDAEGNTLSIASVSSGAGGTVALNGDGTVTFAPGVNFNGAASFNYVASDGALTSNSAIASINVAPVNDAPASAPVALAAIAEDSGPRLITQAQLLANATDVDGPALTASGLALSSGTGTLTDNGNGTWTFTPALNDDSGAAFSYIVSDGTLSAAGSATLDITPVNDAPVNSIPGPQSVNEDTALAFSGANALSVSDVDGNLAGTRLEVGSGTLGVSLAGGATISAGANNSTTLTLSGTSAQINAALATLTYQGLLDFNGAVTLTILSTDGAALPLADSDTVAITVNAVNDVPAISGGAGGAVTEDATLPNLTATGALTIVDADAGESSFVAQPGTVGALGMLVLNSTGTWTYTADNTQAAVQQLAAGATITDTFTAVSADGTASRAVVITFTGTNDVPLLGGTATGNVTEDAAPTLTAAGTLSIADADINESQFVAQTGAAGVFGIFTVDTGGIWSYAAASNQSAIQQLAAGATVSESFTVVSADGTASRDVVITIGGSNDAPLAASHTVAVVGSAVHVFAPGEFGYTDIDGDALATIRVTALPGSGALLLAGVPVTANQEISATDIAAGSLSFVPDAAVSSPAVTAFAFQVSDGTVYSAASYQVSLSVSPGVVRDENGVTPQPGLVTPPVAAPETATAVVPAPSTAATPAPAAGGEAAGGALAPPQPAAPELPPAALLDTPGFEQGVQRSDGFAGVVRTRAADTSSTSFAAILQYALGLNVPQVRADASALPEATLGERAAAATAHSTFIGELDRLRDTAHAEEALERNIIVSSVATGAGMSVGYVLWLLRGGLLLSSLLSSLPAWRFVDPLPVLGRLRDDDDEDLDDDSVESLVQAGVQPYDAQDEDERHA